jgi:predicted phage terminase large subunit-like protein
LSAKLDALTIKGFVQSCLQRKFDKPVASPDCHLEWWELCCSDHNQIAIAAPRKHAKSTSITLSFVLAAALFRQHQFILIVSGTEKQALFFLGDIKQELMENEDIIKLFGVKQFAKVSESDIIVEMTDGYKFRIMAQGANPGGGSRGTKWDNKRPDLIICDDIENDEAVMNSDRRDKFRHWFYGALIQSRSSGGKVIVVGTILHMDSLLERLMPNLNSKTTQSNDLKDWSTSKTYWKSVKYRAHNADFSKILWEEQWSKEALQAERQGMLDQGLSDVYSREFLNYPIDESVAYFKRDDFISLTDEDRESRVEHYSAIDFAISTSERSDYTVIATVAVNPEGDLLVVDIRRGRWDANQIINEMFSVHKRYKPELFVVESGAIQKAIGPFLHREMQQRNTYINLHQVTPTKDKQTRARSLQARMRAGGIRYDKSKMWYPDLEDEMVRFPRGVHDDQVDALAWIGLVLDKIIEAPTTEEDAQEEYNQMVSESIGLQGRSPFTGY